MNKPRKWTDFKIVDRLGQMQRFLDSLEGEEKEYFTELLKTYQERLRKAGVRIGVLGTYELVMAMMEFEMRDKNGRITKRWY